MYIQIFQNSKKKSEIQNTFQIRDGKLVVGDKVTKARGRGRQSKSKIPEGLCKRTLDSSGTV